MALETSVTLHENPLEKTIVWEKRCVDCPSKHRLRPEHSADKVETIITSSKDEYLYGYCVIANASKKVNLAKPRQPVLVSDRDSRLRLSSATTNRTFNNFVKRHVAESRAPVIQAITSQPRPHQPATTNSALCRSGLLQYKRREDDIALYCCRRNVDSIIDCVSCMCGVKAVIYHCTKDSDEEGMVEARPCSCGPPRKSCMARWGCLAACSVFLPCLLCYLPLKGCSEVCVCYKRHNIENRARQKRPKDPV